LRIRITVETEYRRVTDGQTSCHGIVRAMRRGVKMTDRHASYLNYCTSQQRNRASMKSSYTLIAFINDLSAVIQFYNRLFSFNCWLSLDLDIDTFHSRCRERRLNKQVMFSKSNSRKQPLGTSFFLSFIAYSARTLLCRQYVAIHLE